jgi:hypothetical protein
MSEDVPLSAFGSDDDSDDSDGERVTRDEEVEPAESDGEPAVGDTSVDEDTENAELPAENEPAEPPSVTYTSSPDGEPCAVCGETVEKRWRAGEGGVSGDRDGVDDPDALVCPDCKQW